MNLHELIKMLKDVEKNIGGDAKIVVDSDYGDMKIKDVLFTSKGDKGRAIILVKPKKD